MSRLGGGVDVSIIVPTYNEADNVERLVGLLETALASVAFEVIFVDDNSPDGTAEIVKSMARTRPYVRCVHRVGRRGLAGACIEGALSSSADFIVVMDGDLQHDESIIPAMVQRLRHGADLVIGTRTKQQSDQVFSPWRAFVSQCATALAHYHIGASIHDPMSGFFAIRRDHFMRCSAALSPTGFKILLDILTLPQQTLRIEEEYYSFRARDQGASKLDVKNILDYLGLITHKMSAGFLPHRFVLFSIIGGSGLLVHFMVLAVLPHLTTHSFLRAQILATFVAMSSNFFLNNKMTYSDMSLHGLGLLKGLLKFYVICSIGALANIGVADFLFDLGWPWWTAGPIGLIIGSIFNFALSDRLIWTPSAQHASYHPVPARQINVGSQ